MNNINDFIIEDGVLMKYNGKDYDVVVPDNVTSIGDEAFLGCHGLTSVTIPNSVTSIGEEVFAGCHNLTSITIPSGVTIIGKKAFVGCTGLTNINVDEKNPTYCSIDGDLYSKDKTTLICYAPGKRNTSILIPDNVTEIGNYAFYDNQDIADITFLGNIHSIGASAFNYCKNLTSVTVLNSTSCISIYAGAFEDCRSLTSIKIPDSSSMIICKRAFYGCSSLVSVAITDDTDIDDEAFAFCENLTSITIPDSVTNIGEDVFDFCLNLTVYAPEGSYAEEYAEENCIPFEIID